MVKLNRYFGPGHGRRKRCPRTTMCGYWIIAIFALVGTVLSPIAYGKSAKEVFSAVSSGIVVVIVMNERGKEVARGSGVVVSEKHVATNCRVTSGANQFAVRKVLHPGVQDTYRMVAQLIAKNADRDLCLLFVAALSDSLMAPPISLGSAKGASIGDEVYAVGASNGSGLSLSRGIISQLRGDGGKNAAPVIQTDAAVSPGSSGGGLFDQQGKLIGITKLEASDASPWRVFSRHTCGTGHAIVKSG